MTQAYRGPRAALLDELRGLSILLMVLDHGAWDLQNLFGVRVPPLGWPIMAVLEPAFAGLFIVISGMVCNVSRSNLRRGALVLGCAAAITALTSVLMPEQAVYFGILHLLGACMVLYAAAGRLLRRAGPVPGAAVCLALFAVLWPLPDGFVGLPWWRLALPGALYRLPGGFVLGLPAPSFFSGDYFPLLPWGCLFFAGSFAGRRVFCPGAPGWLFRRRAPVLDWAGRHTLWIYLLHQPVLCAVLWAALGCPGPKV